MRLAIYHISGLHKASDGLALFDVSHVQRPTGRSVPLGALNLVTIDARGSGGVTGDLSHVIQETRGLLLGIYL